MSDIEALVQTVQCCLTRPLLIIPPHQSHTRSGPAGALRTEPNSDNQAKVVFINIDLHLPSAK